MKCPFCSAEALDKGNSPNGGTLFVGEDMQHSTECWDLDIVAWECADDPEHVFYAARPEWRSDDV